MGIISWIILGLIAGYLAHRLMAGEARAS